MEIAQFIEFAKKPNNYKKQLKYLATPLIILSCLAMVILPLPSFFLDLLFTFNITLALVVLLSTVYIKKPLDFALFPTVLLITTLLRLSLNVASTRLVLLFGHTGSDAAGKVIEAFGAVVIGGNYAVGIVIFLILIIINFIVVTKGAGRISEVSARFTLDAMPGKQMAIDADLNAGLIDQKGAKQRREEVAQEADFYGSMDGASKFVKGDAIAGLLILFINIVGGLFIGTIEHGLSFSNALSVYTLLTIGDGLVAQIPGLLLSIAAAMIVTRQHSEEDLNNQVHKQLGSQPKILVITASILAVMGIVPGMPHISFLSLAALSFTIAYYLNKSQITLKNKAKEESFKTDSPEAKKSEDISWDDIKTLDTIGLEIGYQLIPLVDVNQSGLLLTRIKGIRKKLSKQMGFLIPPIHIKDNLEFVPNSYQINLLGVGSGKNSIETNKELAINSNNSKSNLEGINTFDPAFGLPAKWIDKSLKEKANSLGFTVVDPSTVVATHISKVLGDNLSLLLGHEEVQNLLDKLELKEKKLVEGLIPDLITLGCLVKILQNLLSEGIAILDLRTILQTIREHALKSKEAEILTIYVRIALKRFIVQSYLGQSKQMAVITLDANLEQILHQALKTTQSEAGIEPSVKEKIITSLQENLKETKEDMIIVLTSTELRLAVAKIIGLKTMGVKVLSYQEIPDDREIKIINVIGN